MNSDFLLVFVVSTAMLLKLGFNNENNKGFDSKTFERLVQTPLQCATFLCLSFYLFNCGLKNETQRGGAFGLPLGLLMTAFKNADGFNLRKEKGFSDKMVGLSILYGSFMGGSMIRKSRGLPIETITNLIN